MKADIKEVLTIFGSVSDEDDGVTAVEYMVDSLWGHLPRLKKTMTTQRSRRQTDRPPPRNRREVPNRCRAKPSSVPQEDEPLIAMEKAAAVTRSERSTHVSIPSIASDVGEFDCEAGYPKEDQTRAYLPIMLVRTKTQVTIAQRALAVQRRSDTSNRSKNVLAVQRRNRSYSLTNLRSRPRRTLGSSLCPSVGNEY
eukprot:1075832_1